MILKADLKKMMPTILFGVGVVGVFVSEVVVSIDTIKAEKVIKEKDIHLKVAVEQTEELAPGVLSTTGYELVNRPLKEFIPEVVKGTWKCYIPTFVATGLTLTCLIASKRLDKKQIAALSTAVAGAGSLVSAYRDKIREYASPEVLEQIDKDVAEAEIKKVKDVSISTPGIISRNKEMDLNTDEEVLFFDPFTKVKFRTSKLSFLGAKYYLNRNFSIGGSAPLSTFYEFLGLTLPEEYMYAGWDVDKMAIEMEYYWIDIDVVKSDKPDPDTGEMYYTIYYGFEPGDTEYSYSYYPGGNPLNVYGSYKEN